MGPLSLGLDVLGTTRTFAAVGRRGALLAIALASGAIGISRPARGSAGNDHPYPVGELGSSMGGAATAFVRDASAPWYNPAGLGRIAALGITASVSAYGLQWERTGRFFDDPSSPAIALHGRTTAIFPSSIGYVMPLDGGHPGGFRHGLGVSVLVPDFDRHAVSLNSPSPALGLTAQERLLEQSLWVMPGWGGCWARVCAGASAAILFHSYDASYDIFLATAPSTPNAAALHWQESTSQLATGVQVGLQAHVTERGWLGLTVRSPIRTLRGDGTVLIVDSGFLDPATTTTRKVWDDGLWSDYRLPLFVRLGGAYEGDRVRIALDVELSDRQATYPSQLARGGATSIQPRREDGTPVGEPIDVSRPSGRDRIVNAAAGIQLLLGKKASLQAGAFTDLSGQTQIDELHPRVHRLGLTFGISRRKLQSTSYLALVATAGRGNSLGFKTSPNTTLGETSPRYETAALYVNLGASADLADLDPTAARTDSSGPPLYRRWWFWAILAAGVAGAVAATVAGAARSPGNSP